jgi:integrase
MRFEVSTPTALWPCRSSANAVAASATSARGGSRSLMKRKAAGIRLWSPHDLRHRRISLLHLRGVPWARIGEFVGQRNLSVTADTYTHVLVDEAELDYGRLLT